MTVWGVIVQAITRKVKAAVAEIRKLVAEAKAEEQKILGETKVAVRALESHITALYSEAEAGKAKLQDELVNKIAQL